MQIIVDNVYQNHYARGKTISKNLEYLKYIKHTFFSDYLKSFISNGKKICGLYWTKYAKSKYYVIRIVNVIK